jgi:hypothetical protein
MVFLAFMLCSVLFAGYLALIMASILFIDNFLVAVSVAWLVAVVPIGILLQIRAG